MILNGSAQEQLPVPELPAPEQQAEQPAPSSRTRSKGTCTPKHILD